MARDAEPPSDAELVERVAAGDESAFATLYDRHVSVVFGSVARFLGDRGAAEEVVQEAYLAVWQRAGQYERGAGSVVGWLLGIARNKSIDRLRAAARRPRLVGPWWHRTAEEEDDRERYLAAGSLVGGAPEADPEDLAARRWVGSVVRSALAAMPEADRRVLELAYDEGLSQTEIAGHLGWPLGTVKSRTRRALAGLREALEGVPDLHRVLEPDAVRAEADR